MDQRLTVFIFRLCFLLGTAGVACSQATAAGFVLSEIFYDPAERTLPIEFIEIQNASTESKSLKGHRLDGGVVFVFPDGAAVAPGGFVVVARDPAAFERRFGFRPMGPWLGTLRRGGERLALRDAANATISEVEFDSGYPWPVAARGAGASMELIHPDLPAQHPGSWRSSQPKPSGPTRVFVPRESREWLFRPGTNQASIPSSLWRQVGFKPDATWKLGQTSIGYGDADDRTPLAGMQNVYSSLFLRHEFIVAPGSVLTGDLALRVRVDDGCIVWINGREAGRFYVPSGELASSALALDHEAGPEFETVVLPDARSWIRDGTNVVAIHAFNATLGSSDFTIDAELRTPDAAGSSGFPSPGLTNSVFSTRPAPLLGEVRHSPEAPRSGEAVLVTVSTGAAVPIDSVTLQYAVVSPGNYVRRDDPAYSDGWVELPMRDDGQAGDLKAGDGLFSVVVPGTLQRHRHLVRYRVVVRGTGGATVSVPYADDESPNFSWFTYDGAPAWRGAKRPGVAGADGEVRTFSTNLLGSLPIYHLIAREDDVLRSQYNGGFNGVRFFGTLIYDGQVYDHIQFHNRGEASTYVSGKNKWRIHFNRARKFKARDAWGRPYNERWDVLNLNGCSSPWAAVHRGMSGLDEAISFRVYGLLGLPSSHTHHVQFRVIDAAVEAAATDQYAGDLWGLYLAVEHPDGSFLDERRLGDGNLYKLEGGPDKKHQGSTHPLDLSDWNSFAARSGSTQPAAWWRTNMDLRAYYSFHAGNRVVGNVDLREGWNHYFYHSTNGLWVPVPWDLDMQFIPKSHWSGTIAQKACLNTPEFRVEYGNRAREILDLFLENDAADGGQIGQLIDETAGFIRPLGVGETWPELDQALWNYHPRTSGDGSAGGQTNHRGNFFRTPFADSRIGGAWTRRLATADFNGFLAYLREYCTDTFGAGNWTVNNGQQKGYGYRFLASEAADAAIPLRPVIQYEGSPGFSLHDLRFSVSGFMDPQGSGTFRSVRWRIARVSAPGLAGFEMGKPRHYEIEPVWESGELTSIPGPMRIPAADLRPGQTYRVRARYMDQTGRASAWSLPIQFVASAPSIDIYRRDLRITEIMYHPVDPIRDEIAAGYESSDFEFVELANLGPEKLDLSDVRLAGGIEFSFPVGFELAAGARTVVAAHNAAFRLRYGRGAVVAGVFSGKLANDGDTIRVEYGNGTAIAEVSYFDKAPWPTAADGLGPSLEWVGSAGQAQGTLSLWRASAVVGGSAGGAEGLSYGAWAAGRPALSDPMGDSDGDGILNWVEFATGGDPFMVDRGLEVQVVKDSTSASLVLLVRMNLEAEGIQFLVENSGDLVGWKLVEGGFFGASARLGRGWGERRLPLATGSSNFFRIKLDRTPSFGGPL